MAKLVAIGNRAFVLALAGVGAETVACESVRAFSEALRRTALRREVELVFVPEPLAREVPEAVQAFERRSRAALLALPLMPSERHPSLEEVRHLVEQATGATLI
jgi:vacuolar-type H+-ATPase subunit F/Vma7